MSDRVQIVGGGLAGTECAFQLAERGVDVTLHEMRPQRDTPAHKTDRLAELVCSNSLRSDDPEHAAGLLKREMESFDSLIIGAARAAAVPAGSALAVDRDRFAEIVTGRISDHPRIEVRREELKEIPEGRVVLATGPLTSPQLAESLQTLLGSEYLYFYDSIAPIVHAESLDYSKLFWASRYDKGDGDDYLNAPFDEPGYIAFHQAILDAEVVELHDFEKKLFFEGCLPIEELARRGLDTLRYGPMKPVGLTAPNGERPWAVIQARQENLAKSQLNLVGFQSRMTWGEQKRVFRTIPGFENAEFVRLGQVHRNTFINSPTHLDSRYRLKIEPRIRMAGQITGVEGYLESAATGLIVALYLAMESSGREYEPFPATMAMGALARHLTESAAKNFQPANINYGLFTDLGMRLRKRERRGAYVRRAHKALSAWQRENGFPYEPNATPTPEAVAP